MSKYVLGLDVGERRIGVALASRIARLPAPLRTIDRLETPDALAEIQKLIAQHDVDTIVVGLPRNMQGNETAQTAATRQFAAELGAQTALPVIMQDEAGTSLEAEALLKSYKKPYSKADIDAQAAVIILRDYLAQTVEHSA